MIGFIGAGNMSTALIQGMADGGIPTDTLAAYDLSEARMEAIRAVGAQTAESLEALISKCELVVLCIKPKDTAALLTKNCDSLTGKLVLSIVTGWSQAMLEAALPGALGIARMMPNTPALAKEGVLAFCANHTFDKDAFEKMHAAFSACGRAVVVPETLLDAVTCVSGCGPAYVYMFIEALADGGVRQGLPRQMAYTLAAQTVLGAAKMVLETGEHPGALKDAVCSPGGVTIEAVYALEKAGLRAAVMDAVDAAARKLVKM